MLIGQKIHMSFKPLASSQFVAQHCKYMTKLFLHNQFVSSIFIHLRFIHLQTFKCTMWYIKTTLNMGIKWQHQNNGNILYEFFDVDWVGDKDTWWSTSSYCFMLIGGIVTWVNKKKPQLFYPGIIWIHVYI
jgi:hypothetical protein